MKEHKNQEDSLENVSTREVEVLKMLAQWKTQQGVAQGWLNEKKRLAPYKRVVMRKWNVDNLVYFITASQGIGTVLATRT